MSVCACDDTAQTLSANTDRARRRVLWIVLGIYVVLLARSLRERSQIERIFMSPLRLLRGPQRVQAHASVRARDSATGPLARNCGWSRRDSHWRPMPRRYSCLTL